MTGARAKSYIDSKIVHFGTSVSVTRPGVSGSKTFPCLAQSLSRDAVAQLMVEGALNAGAGMAHIFTFKGDADVAERDEVSLAGTIYKLVQATPTIFQGISVKLTCVGVRR